MSNPRPRRTRLAAFASTVALMATLAVVGVVGTAVPANAAYTTACSGATDTHFSDHPGTAANCLFDYGIAKGKSDGTFGEDDNLIRAQFASFVTRFLDAAGVAHSARTTFPDVNSNSVPDASVLQEIEEGHAAGVVNGYSAQSKEVVNGETCVGTGQPCQPGDFGPEHNMSVAQACTIILNMMDAIHAANPAAPAGNATGDPSTDYDACVANGILDLNAKDAGGTVYPNGKTDTIKRGLFADMLAQTVQKEVDAGVVQNVYTGNQQFKPDTTGNPTVITFNPTSSGGSGLKTKVVTFSNVGTDPVSVALMPCGGDNGPAGFAHPDGTFHDADTTNPNSLPDGKADGVGYPAFLQSNPEGGFIAAGTFSEGGNEGELEILSINGSPAANGGYDANVTPDAGTVAVAVSNFTDEGDCGQVLVFRDGNADDALNLDAANKPSEAFGVSGPIVWTGGEAPNGYTGGDITFFDAATGNMYTDGTNGVFMKLRSNDMPFYFNDVTCCNSFPITMANFKQWVTSGDFVDFETGSYSQSGANSFDLSDDFTQPPSSVTATQGKFDTDPGGASDDVKLSMVMPTDGNVDHICAIRDGAGVNNLANGGSDCTPDGSGPSVNTIVDSNPGPGTFHYRVEIVSVTDDNSDYSEPVTITVNTPVGPVAGAPFAVSAVHTDGNGNGKVDNGDILVTTFNETMNDPASDSQLVVCEVAGDSTCGLFQNGTNATFTKVAANRIVVIVGAAGPVIINNGADGTLEYGQSVTAVSLAAPANTHGFTDTDEGLEWDPNSGANLDTTY